MATFIFGNSNFQTMKHISLVLAGIFLQGAVIAQKVNPEPSDIIKINVGSVFAKNISLQYERATGSKTSLGVGIRFQPFSSLPFQHLVADAVNDPDIQIGNIKVGNFALTPEFRYYFGKKALKGFYIAPYARYANYKMEAPVSYASLFTTKTAFFKGNISSFSGGLLLGSQFSLSKKFIVDWWIVGGHFGSSSGSLNFVASLTPAEQSDLRTTLDNADIPLFKIEYDINSNGGTIRSKGAWAGFRGFAVNLGYRF